MDATKETTPSASPEQAGFSGAPGSEPVACPCQLWARTDGKATNHHPNCEHYNDSLIPVWRFSSGDGTSFVTDQEPTCVDLIEASEAEISVSREEMHREIYEHLQEFGGF